MTLNAQSKRVGKTRVSITYDVLADGKTESRELPFVVGVIGDFTGNKPDSLMQPPEERVFVTVDQDNFDKVVEQIHPTLDFKVPDMLSGSDGDIAVHLDFTSRADFSPAKVAAQIPALNRLIQVRKRLRELLGKADRSRELEEILKNILTNSGSVAQLAKELGVECGKKEETDNE